MNSRRLKRLNRICRHQFEDRTASYSNWHAVVRGSVTLPQCTEDPRNGLGHEAGNYPLASDGRLGL
jgi:hypothetical protein